MRYVTIIIVLACILSPMFMLPGGTTAVDYNTGYQYITGTYDNGTAWDWNVSSSRHITVGTPAVETSNIWVIWYFADNGLGANQTYPVDWSFYMTITWSFNGYNLTQRLVSFSNTTTDIVTYETAYIQGYVLGASLHVNSTDLGFLMDEGDGIYQLTVDTNFNSVSGYSYTKTYAVNFTLASGSLPVPHMGVWTIFVCGTIGILFMALAFPVTVVLFKMNRHISAIGALLIMLLVGYVLVNTFILNAVI